jgi:hypothetical protein
MNPTNDTIVKDTLKKIKEIYLKRSYMDRYGTDVWISAVLCVIFTILICHQYLTNVLEVVRSDWPNQRCNPLFMPFAGFINKPTDRSNLEYTVENFSGCITSILEFIALAAFQPFKIILQILNDAINYLVESFNKIRGLLDQLRRQYADIFDQIFTALSNLLAAFMNFVVKLKDIFEKTKGILTTILFTLFGAYMTMESAFLIVIDLIVLILIIIACIIVVYICVATGLFPIPIIGPAVATAPSIMAIVIIVIMIGITIPVIWFMIMMLKVLNLSSPPTPKIPGCFQGNTVISLVEGDKYIKDIKIGDTLKDGGIVTATIQFSATSQNIYNLNGVIVSGEHRVLHSDWIKVKDHPNSVHMPLFNEPFVYCLNTDTKAFVIGDTIFSDWDDIDTKVLSDLQTNCVSNGYLPESFTYADIHTHLESGFHPETLVSLNSGLFIPICEVEVNDVLENNTKVLGVIRIQGNDVNLYKHTFANDAFICGTKNIHIDDINLGKVNCMQSESMRTRSEPMPILYHLLTDSKFFMANAIKVNDYNYGIDVYLK